MLPKFYLKEKVCRACKMGTTNMLMNYCKSFVFFSWRIYLYIYSGFVLNWQKSKTHRSSVLGIHASVCRDIALDTGLHLYLILFWNLKYIQKTIIQTVKRYSLGYFILDYIHSSFSQQCNFVLEFISCFLWYDMLPFIIEYVHSGNVANAGNMNPERSSFHGEY